ncbi:MAG TPA: hypothetical protein EYN66_02300 [Myxococcales bacterium]|nr:hypothetical protein [Myxococcales bacterium]
MIVRELPEVSERERDMNAQLREQARRDAMRGQSIETAISEPKRVDNSVTLMAGEHAGARLAKPHTSILGTAGSQITKPVTIDESARFTNVHFKDQISITSTTATVMFVGCRFDVDKTPVVDIYAKAPAVPPPPLVGAKVHFVGCTFTNDPGGVIIENPGVITDVHVVGCSNVTGQALGNVTPTAVTT